ncbi:MAG: sulfite exporter TauE/SafE family protein [Bacteroidetes bacterium]|nr:sulfite exporter TauE/SafE family protein [Bacteroidota bacterium]
MSELFLILIFLSVGFSAGILIGMLGIGGGVIFIPALYFLLPYTGIDQSFIPYFVISISLFAGAIAASFSSIFHFHWGNVDKGKALLFALGSAPAAFISATLVTSVSPIILKGIFAGVLFIIAIKMFLDSQSKRESKRKEPINDYSLPIIGLFVGILAAFTGLGGGIIFFPVLHYLFLLEPKNAIGTSSVITAITMIFASLSFFINKGDWMGEYQSSNTYFAVAIPLGISAVVGARIGVSFVINMQNSITKKIFSILLIIVVIKIIFDLW